MQQREKPSLSPTASHQPIREAYSARVPLMPWRDKSPVAEYKLESQWRYVERQAGTGRPRVAYVHVPFCANHCLFCGFYKNHYNRQSSGSYVDAVIAELQREAGLPMVGQVPVEALYLGGGTPTALETPDLVRLITALRTYLPLAPDCEVTLEGRILHFDQNKIDAALDAGVNRISIGVQSFDTGVRRAQGRRASGDEAAAFIQSLTARRKASVVIDLMYGLPGQTPEVWQKDLETSLALAPDGLDIYCLSLIPGAPLGKALQAGKLASVASLADQGSYYQQATELFQAAGWHQVSNSHWARTTRERNLYNLMIKSGAETLAFGSGAGGSLGAFSYSVQGDLNRYLEQTAAGQKPVSGMLKADSWQPLRERVIAGVEIGRLNYRSLFQCAEEQAVTATAWQTLVDEWQNAGLAEYRHGSLWLTTAGRFWGNNLQAHASATLIAPLRQMPGCSGQSNQIPAALVE